MRISHLFNPDEAANALITPLRRCVLIFGIVLTVFPIGASAQKVKVEKPVASVPAAALSQAFFKSVPDSLEDLQQIEKQVTSITELSIHSTVSVRVGDAQGSGVIIDHKAGYILTAAHVIGLAQKNATIILHDGRTLKGRIMGLNRGMDAGLVKLVEDSEVDISKLPEVKMGDITKTGTGRMGTRNRAPNGYQAGRAPVVRLGKSRLPQETSNTNRLHTDRRRVPAGRS